MALWVQVCYHWQMSHMSVQGCNFSVKPDFSKHAPIMLHFVVPVSQSVEIFFLWNTLWKSAVPLSTVWVWIISWGHSIQESESSIGSCSLKSENCEFLHFVSLVRKFPFSLTVSFLSIFDLASFAKCTAVVVYGLPVFWEDAILFVVFQNLLFLDYGPSNSLFMLFHISTEISALVLNVELC